MLIGSAVVKCVPLMGDSRKQKASPLQTDGEVVSPFWFHPSAVVETILTHVSLCFGVRISWIHSRNGTARPKKGGCVQNLDCGGKLPSKRCAPTLQRTAYDSLYGHAGLIPRVY